MRDQRTGYWEDLSTVEDYPGNVVAVALAVSGPELHVVVRNAEGKIAHSSCTVYPKPGHDDNQDWPANCSPFWDLTPPS